MAVSPHLARFRVAGSHTVTGEICVCEHRARPTLATPCASTGGPRHLASHLNFLGAIALIVLWIGFWYLGATDIALPSNL